MVNKKIKDQSKSEDQDLVTSEKQSGRNQGIANKRFREATPSYDKVGSEKVDKGFNNTLIIQGRDRPNTAQSGYGARGATQAGRIDLIAGLASSYKHTDGTFGPPNRRTIVNPNFALDAARVYISQKADIDRYMGIAPIEGDPIEEARSAIGMKADQIRIHSRQDIKLVTGKARIDGAGADGETLSNGGVNDIVGKISFIAGNYTEPEEYLSFSVLDHQLQFSKKRSKIQPIPKGENLVMCLREIVDSLNYLAVCAGSNTRILRQLNTAFTTHVHGVAGPITSGNSGMPSGIVNDTILSVQTADLKHYRNGLGMIKNSYLNQSTDLVKGALYINSNFVFTT